MARANPTTNPPRSTMTDPNLLRKERQDEARRQQQADERVRELEEEIERLHEAIRGWMNILGSVRRNDEAYGRAQDLLHDMKDVLTDGGNNQ